VLQHGFRRSAPSAEPPDEFTLGTCIRDLDAILDAVGAESVHYCGESLGGILGMVFAAERPRRVRTLRLISG
jgi:pimeloyl-ACP methyl ester carboxylesterase